MRVKTKVVLFLVAVFACLIAGFFAGWKFSAGATGIVGLLGAIFSGRAIPRSSGSTKAADNAANDARAEASGNAASMDRVVQSGKSLVEQSEELIRETGCVKGPANK